MARAALTARIFINRLIKFVVLLAVAYGCYWCYVNWDYIRHRGTRQYQETRYGITWHTNLRSAKNAAETNKRQVMIVYIRSNAKNASSDQMITRLFPSRDFQIAAETYIPLLCEVREGAEETTRAQANRDDIIKTYNLSDHYGQLILTGANGNEINRVTYSGETASQLISKLSGGAFKALPPIVAPKVKDPVADSISQTAEKAKSAVAKKPEQPEPATSATPVVPAAESPAQK